MQKSPSNIFDGLFCFPFLTGRAADLASCYREISSNVRPPVSNANAPVTIDPSSETNAK
jgi:hypothetical protein